MKKDREYWRGKREKAREFERQERAFFRTEARKELNTRDMIPLPKEMGSDSIEVGISRMERETRQRERKLRERLKELDEKEYSMHWEELERYSDFFREQAGKEKIKLE